MNFIDTCLMVPVVILSLTGYARGFLRTMIGPIAFTLATAAAFLLFKNTKNFLSAICIGIFGPIFIGWLTNILLDNTLLRNKLPRTSIFSRLAGATFNALWGSAIMISILAALIVIPLDVFNLGDINTAARTSTSYKLLKQPFTAWGIIPPDEAKDCASGVCSMPEKKKADLTSDADVQSIINDPRVLRLISDPTIQAAIEKQDIAAMLTNPIVAELGKDPAFISKALRLYPKIKAASQP